MINFSGFGRLSFGIYVGGIGSFIIVVLMVILLFVVVEKLFVFVFGGDLGRGRLKSKNLKVKL